VVPIFSLIVPPNPVQFQTAPFWLHLYIALHGVFPFQLASEALSPLAFKLFCSYSYYLHIHIIIIQTAVELFFPFPEYPAFLLKHLFPLFPFSVPVRLQMDPSHRSPPFLSNITFRAFFPLYLPRLLAFPDLPTWKAVSYLGRSVSSFPPRRPGFRSQVRSCGIHVGQSCSGAGFLRDFGFP
jgi:hypothetical protein